MRKPSEYYERHERNKVRAGNRYAVRIEYQADGKTIESETRRMDWRKAQRIRDDFSTRRGVVSCVIWDYKFNRTA